MASIRQVLMRAGSHKHDQRIHTWALSLSPATDSEPFFAMVDTYRDELEEDRPWNAAPPAPDAISLEVPTYMVWGANTGVGKTLVSAGVAASAAKDEVRVCDMQSISINGK